MTVENSYTMAEPSQASARLIDKLKSPLDLEKIQSLKAEFIRKKAAIDEQLKTGLREQLQITQTGMDSISESQKIVNQIKEEMMNIDKLCAESQSMIRDFPNINVVAQIYRNFQQVEARKESLDSFNRRLQEIDNMTLEDDMDQDEQPNLLNIHYALTKLRDERDEAMAEIKEAADESLEGTLQDYFLRLDEVVSQFDAHLNYIYEHLIRLLTDGKRSTIVRMALIVEQEEKTDMKVKAMQDAQKEHAELAHRFKSIKAGTKQIRGYKEKFIEAIAARPTAAFALTEQKFLEDSSKLEKSLKWYFNDLNAVKVGMVTLMPKKWKIFRTYVNIYHQLMHDFFVKLISDEGTSSAHLLAIIHWRSKYYEKMAKFASLSPTDLQPDVLDDREAELVRDYRQLILRSVEEWMSRIFNTDRAAYLARNEDALDKDAHGCFRTKTLSDMWRMFREQVQFAGDSSRTDVVEGVIDEMFRALKRRQTQWGALISEDVERYSRPDTDPSDIQSLQDWLVAIANDQIACIDDHEEVSQISYLTRFRRDFEPLVSPTYLSTTTTAEIDSIRDGYVDLGTACIASFVQLIFAVDFRAVLPELFTQRWYGEYGMKRMTSTFDDYIADYEQVLHHSMLELLLEELADALLVRYLLAVRNKGAKFRRQDAFADKIADDVRTAFSFFEKHAGEGGGGLDFALVKGRWKAVHHLVRLLEVDKLGVPDAFEACKREFWDVQIGWVESVLRSRDDFERSMLSAVKARAAAIGSERGLETVMSKVK